MFLCLFQLDSHLQQGHAVIIQPTGVSDNLIKFTAKLAVGVNMVIDVSGVQDAQNLRIQASPAFPAWTLINLNQSLQWRNETTGEVADGCP